MSETDETQPRKAEDSALPGGNFQLFVQKLGYQALISLGVLENPVTQTKTVQLQQARGVIDDLMMLREKCRGNLEGDDEKHLDMVIGNLQQHFTQISQEGAAKG